MSEPDEEERTDPSIVLPETRELTMEVQLPELRDLPAEEAGAPTEPPGAPPPLPPASAPPPIPPASRRPPTAPPAPPGFPPATAPAPPGFPPATAPAPPPPAAPLTPAPPPASMTPTTPGHAATPPSSAPKAPAEPISTPPPARLGRSVPPGPPAPRRGLPARKSQPAPQRERVAQMDSRLDQVRSRSARQKNELDELRERLEAKERKLEEMLEQLQGAGSVEEMREMLDTLDIRRDTLAGELRARLTTAEREVQDTEVRLSQIEETVNAIHDGSEMTRVRMRLDRVGNTLTAIERRLTDLEDQQRQLHVTRDERQDRFDKVEARLERIESLFEELVDEMREKEEAVGLDAIRARVDDMEALVLDAGRQVDAQRDEIRKMSDSIVPPAVMQAAQASIPKAPLVPSEGTLEDDLTKIKGIGPKYARKLRELGITRYAHIAKWSIAEVERVAGALNLKPKRIINAGWVDSAAELAAKS